MADKSKMIEITLPKDRGRKEDPRGEYVAVNGVGMFVPRGEKVKIPEAKENIRMISIYLGDQQTSAVVRGKIAKKKRLEASKS